MTISRLGRSVALVLAFLLFAATPAALAQSQEPIADNEAIAINEVDGATLLDLALDVVLVTDGIVDQTNLALAYSSCEACSTLAVAIQLVFVVGNATVVQPENVAIALNDSCTLCNTFAVAYQFVVGVGEGPIMFTPEGRKMLKHVYNSLSKLWKDLGKGRISIETFLAELDLLMDQVDYVLDNELVPGETDESEEDEGEEVAPSPSPSSTPTDEPSPEDTPTVSPSGEPTEDPTPEPEPTTTP